MTVIDASALLPALVDDGPMGHAARSRIAGAELIAPELIDLEVVSVLRRRVLANLLDERRAQLALADLAHLPLKRAPHAPLLPRIWRLRASLTPYDAAYVALAEALDAELLTADARLASAPGLRCAVSLLH